MAEPRLIRTKNKSIKNRKNSPLKESLKIELLREGGECPNCHFALFKKEDNEIFCPVCGYGRQTCI